MADGPLEALVAAARQGDRGAFEALVRATTADTYALAYRLTGNEDDARDVVQDAYLRAFRGLRRFRGDAQFATWMFRITANCASTLLTRRARLRTEVLLDDAPVVDGRPEHDPEARATAAEGRALVADAVAQLPWGLRQVIVLRDIYDLPHRAIASELGISEAAAKVRLHRARRLLRERLDDPVLRHDPISGDPISGNPISQAPIGQAPIGQAPIGQAPIGDTKVVVGRSEGREANAQ